MYDKSGSRPSDSQRPPGCGKELSSRAPPAAVKDKAFGPLRGP
jgi:hypothetical protein